MGTLLYKEIWTDGGAGKSKVRGILGGWAWLMPSGEHANGGFFNVTSNQMELYAVFHALRSLHLTGYTGPVVVYSDSQYTVNGFNLWWRQWKRNGWTTSNGTKVKNRDLWKALISIRKHFLKVELRWVKGHAGILYNEKADKLVGRGKKLALPEVEFSLYT